MVDRDDLALIQQRLEESDRLDARRIELDLDGDTVILRGAVAEPEEASAAMWVVEQLAPGVVSELRVDRNLREGATEPRAAEAATPMENEILIGNTDMLAGPDAQVTSDLSRALEESEPWDPPEEPVLAPLQAEYAGDLSDGDASEEGVVGHEVERREFAAADLTQQELEAAATGSTVPSLDPEAVAPPDGPEPDPAGVDSFGRVPNDDVDSFPPQVPGTAQGVGATGTGTAGGGSVSGVPATETGASGADTAAADPVRSTGGTMSDSGTDRGPEAREDPAVREDFPEED